MQLTPVWLCQQGRGYIPPGVADWLCRCVAVSVMTHACMTLNAAWHCSVALLLRAIDAVMPKHDGIAYPRLRILLAPSETSSGFVAPEGQFQWYFVKDARQL